MNDGALNTYALNGSVVDPTVTSTVVGYAFAAMDVLGRAIVFGPGSWFAEANASPSARVRMGQAASGQAQASSSVTVRAMVRSIVAASASVFTEYYSGVLRSVVNQAVSATAVVTSRVWARLVVSSVAETGLAGGGKVSMRDPTPETAEAATALVPRVSIRSPGGCTAEAVGYADGSVSVHYPFDEVADSSRTFIVPPVTQTFTVG